MVEATVDGLKSRHLHFLLFLVFWNDLFSVIMISRGFCTTGHMPFLSWVGNTYGLPAPGTVVPHRSRVPVFVLLVLRALPSRVKSTQMNSRIWFALKSCGLSTTVDLNHILKNDVFSKTVFAVKSM